ncbi:VWA domain-containing protein [uncultured Paludibaculum sp.]|uniref:vWA domain-containing protein n=1 Tax=uncultured Paludibaculum sp. TaxID=1765020 RepID=UPI002AAB5752|nr:VWA domain-containing protein [uncultured Paludibaculum sp.]
MKKIRYGRYEETDLGLSAEDLMQMLGDLMLDSGFDGWRELTMEELREALKRALEERGEFDQQRIEQALDGLLAKLEQEGYLNREEQKERPVRVEITDKAIDFLGFKTLKDLMGALGRSSFGAHETRDLSTGVESSGSSKKWEFGDTLNLDASATLFSALQREGAKLPLEIEYDDLHVHQSEYQSSCATVLMLDCSHSMILYGEDRFTPAKRVALALSHLIRTQFPGDSLRLVLFHDTAEEVRLGELARVQVGPYYTNTRDGLILAQRILASEKKDMKQIVMITDGKPSALTLEDGRIYKNPMGLDPLVLSKTLEEVGRCKRAGILINTFMLASDYSLVQFVQKVTEMCRGKAYFTTPYNLGQYLLMDFLNRKTRTIH